MGESILTSIKTQLALMPEDESFDKELIIFINAAFARLTQLGVGPREGYRITDDTNTWDEFVVDITQEEMSKVYVYLKVKSLFDPATNSSLSKHMEEQIKEYEWLLKVEAEDDAQYE
jgi:hypothetical protein